jgi:hypothetical protein
MFSPIVPVSCFNASASVPAPPNGVCSSGDPSAVVATPSIALCASSVSAICSAVWPNASLRATKSVSLSSSTSTPVLPSVVTRETIFPSDAARPARDSPREMPFLRSHSTAWSMSPWHSSSAFLQSIMPA